MWGFTNVIFKQMLKVSAFYLEKQKSFIHKKKFLSCCQFKNKKALLTDPIFSEGFAEDQSDWSQLRFGKVCLLNLLRKNMFIKTNSFNSQDYKEKKLCSRFFLFPLERHFQFCVSSFASKTKQARVQKLKTTIKNLVKS